MAGGVAAVKKDNSSLPTQKWDTKYEWKAILLLALAFGFVGVDRFMIMPIFPLMAEELGLDYGAIGIIGGALSLAWGLSSFFTGGLADKVGRKKVIIPSIIVFSLLAGVSGLAHSMISLVMIRALIGVSEGAFTPAGIIATVEASKPSRQGLNIGLQQMAMPLLGMGLAPIFVGWLLSMGLHWRWAFALVTIPGIIVALFMAKVLRDVKPQELSAHTSDHDTTKHKFTDVFKYRNVPLNIMIVMGWLACEITLAILLPSYLIDVLGLTKGQMIFVLTAFGFGAALGTVVLPGISDFIGRKKMAIIGGLLCLVFTYLLKTAGPNPGALFGILFMLTFFSQGLIGLTVGPMAAESVPPTLMASSTGVTIGIGEIFGGGCIPIIGGFVAKSYGLPSIFIICLIGPVVGILLSLLVKETAPRILAKKEA